LDCTQDKRAGSGTSGRGGKDDVRTYAERNISRQGVALVQLVHAVWQFFQSTGEELRVPVWAPQERSITAA
jgi:hypothetical protein